MLALLQVECTQDWWYHLTEIVWWCLMKSDEGINLHSCKVSKYRGSCAWSWMQKHVFCLCNQCSSNLIQQWCCPCHKQLVKSSKAIRWSWPAGATAKPCQAQSLSTICALTALRKQVQRWASWTHQSRDRMCAWTASCPAIRWKASGKWVISLNNKQYNIIIISRILYGLVWMGISLCDMLSLWENMAQLPMDVSEEDNNMMYTQSMLQLWRCWNIPSWRFWQSLTRQYTAPQTLQHYLSIPCQGCTHISRRDAWRHFQMLSFDFQWQLTTDVIVGFCFINKGCFLRQERRFWSWEAKISQISGCVATLKISTKVALHSLIEFHNGTATMNAVTQQHATLISCTRTCQFNADQPRVLLRHKIRYCNPVVKEPQRAALKQQEVGSWCAWGTHRLLKHGRKQTLRKGPHQVTRLSPHPIGLASPHMRSLHWTRGSMQRSITLWVAILISLLLAIHWRGKQLWLQLSLVLCQMPCRPRCQCRLLYRL